MAIKITYEDMPHMKPVPMETKSKGFFGGIWLWIATTRKWEITKDWKFAITHEGNKYPKYYKIPKGFVFDGASVPKFARSWLSPMGVLLSGGLVHDWIYKYESLNLGGKKGHTGKMTQKERQLYYAQMCGCFFVQADQIKLMQKSQKMAQNVHFWPYYINEKAKKFPKMPLYGIKWLKIPISSHHVFVPCTMQ